MKKFLFLIFAIVIAGSFAMSANAQMLAPYGTEGSRSGMGARLPDLPDRQAGRQGFSNSSADWNEVVEHTLREEKEGKELWDKFQAKEVACADLTDEQFGVLGEYFMGQMMGDSHASMNAMMMQMHGEEGEEQIHIVMGQRLSACDTSAVATGISGGWLPMMNMMMGGWPIGQTMMNFGFTSFSWFGWIFIILWWALIIIVVIALVKWLAGQFKGGTSNKNALDILKERYAKGEIDKKEFEERKKDLV